MNTENKAGITVEFLRRQLKEIANLDLSQQAAGAHELIAGLIEMMNTLQPEGYAELFPALTFRPIKE